MAEKKSTSALQGKIEQQLSIEGASFAVAFKDLQKGTTLFINERMNFHAASTMKTPVLIELYRQASLGRFSLSDSLEIRNTFHSIVDGSIYSLNATDDSDQTLYTRLGEKESIAALAYSMIIRSSNLATNLLIELVKADSVMQTMNSIGARDIRVLRGVEDNKAYSAGLNNTTTAYDLMLIFELLAKQKIVSPSASEEMINILLDQEFDEIIPAHLPAGVRVAHKTGSITGVQHDSGIVMLPDGRKYVLILLSKFNPADEKNVIGAMAQASKTIYEFVISNQITGKRVN